ncbi:hypothetical protein FB451DRAFT_1255307 [Mycena latifolia]|nr:hypothetical protein FB451DRAFT_1255307 [Mycena latifolia]
MAGSDLSWSVLEISELRTYIVDFLHDSKQDLKSCALVSRAFTFAAQSHLFREISFGWHLPNRNTAALRLTGIMDSSPHLQPHVRRVTAVLDLFILNQISRMNLLHVTRLDLYNGSTCAMDVAIVRAAGDLVSLPSLHTIYIEGGFPDYAALNLLFAHCTPSLRTLCMSFVAALKSPSELAPARIGAPAGITHLRVLATAGVAAWFLDPQCPLDLSGLRRIEISERRSDNPDPLWSTLRDVLNSVRPSLEDLHLNGHDIPGGLSLGAFPGVTKLHLTGTPDVLSPALATLLPSIGGLTTLALASSVMHRDDTVFALFAHVDLLLSREELPALVRVELCVLPPSHTLGVDSEKIIAYLTARVTSAFAHMHRRGVLVVQNI